MKTVFKEGMEVYDQLNFPNKKGVIVEISNDENDPYPVEVSFENEAGRKYYTPEGRFNKKHIPTLSTKPYEIELKGFEQKAPAPTYEDIVKERNYIYLPENLVAPNKELADAVVALLKLLFLRDYYNEGWQPDWSKKNRMHFCIRVRNNKITTDNNSDINEFNTVLVFTDYTIRDKFLEEQRELLKIAKPLLW